MMDMMNMGMDKMMNMGMDQMSNMGAQGSMNMSTPMGSMNGMASMNMGNMGNMPGMDPSAMAGMQGMQGMQGYGMQGMPGMSDPNAMAGAKNSLLGLGGNLDFNSLLGGILNLAIDLFVILLIVGIVVGAAVYIKRYLFDGLALTPAPKIVCPHCGTTIKAEWNNCPKCGQAKPVLVNATPQTA